ncbi:MAG: DUF3718 domain-containing protein [Colwellia sp.]|nr:DUF3718 domain-containing protein [Colwellia sp.]
MNIKKLSIATLCAFSFVASTNAIEVSAADNSVFSELCVTASAGNRAAFSKAIKSSGYSPAFIAKQVQCNGQSIQKFIETNGKNASSMLVMLDHKTNGQTIELAKK